MKIKIFLFPTLLVLIIAAIIWFVQPQYESLKKTKKQVENKQSEFEQIQAKNQKVKIFIAELDKNNDKEELLGQYLPVSQKQEEAINAINYLANDSQVLVIDLSAAEEKPVSRRLTEIQEELQAAENLTLGDVQSTEFISKLLKKDAEFLNMEVVLSGSYENIKRMLSGLYHLDNFVDLQNVIVEIPKKVGDESFDPNLLTAKIKLSFYDLPAVSVVGQQNPLRLMTLSAIDFKPIENLENIIKEVPDVKFEGAGRINPFVL